MMMQSPSDDMQLLYTMGSIMGSTHTWWELCFRYTVTMTGPRYTFKAQAWLKLALVN